MTLSRALVAAGCFALLCTAAPSRADDAPNEKEARDHFRAGVRYLQDIEGERYEEAYAEFKAAYSLSKSPKVLGNIGLCAMKLERDGEAIETYSRYLREVSDIAPDERAQIERDLESLTASAAHLTVTVQDGSAMVLDTRLPTRGSSVRNAYGPVQGTLELLVRPGHHQISATREGHEFAVWEVNVGAGERQSRDFKAAHESARPRSPKTGPWIVTGVGAAVLVAGAASGVAALRKVNNIEKKCPNDACPPGSGFESDVDSARSLVRATDYLLLGGGVLVGVGIGWFLLDCDPSPAASDASKVAAASHRARPAGGCNGRGCFASVEVSF